jgi:hypothetical protein
MAFGQDQYCAEQASGNAYNELYALQLGGGR